MTLKTPVLGARLCPYCPQEQISLGVDEDGYRLLVPTVLRDVIGETPEWWILDCAHNLHKTMPFLSCQEYIGDPAPPSAGHLETRR